MDDALFLYTTQIVRLHPAVAELRLEFPELPADLAVRGRLMGPRCPGVSTVEVAYQLQMLKPGLCQVVIPEPSLWAPEHPFVYEGPVTFWRGPDQVKKITISLGLRNG